MTTNGNCFIKRLDKLIRNVRADLGSEAFMFLDTGAIIDIEEERRKMVNGQSKSVSQVFDLFKMQGLPLYVTSEVLREVYNHAHNYSLNGGIPEISREAYERAMEMNSGWTNFIADSGKKIPLDEVRYQVFLGSHATFEEGHKKREIDQMSAVDRELVSAALWSRYFTNDRFTTTGFPSGVGVLTSDEHVQGTIDFLTSAHIPDNLRYRGIKAFNTRKDF